MDANKNVSGVRIDIKPLGLGKGKRFGAEIKLNKTFSWGGNEWTVPSAFMFSKGIVLDIFAKIDGDIAKKFVEKCEWLELSEEATDEDIRKAQRENPFAFVFDCELVLNGVALSQNASIGDVLVGFNDNSDPEELVELFTKYGISRDESYIFRRISFLYATKKKPDVKSMSIKLSQRPINFESDGFCIRNAGERVELVDSHTEERYALTAIAVENERMMLNDEDGMKMPSCVTHMSYAVFPEIPENQCRIVDVRQSDAVKFGDNKVCRAIGVIGGADGPTAIFIGAKDRPKFREAFSAMTYEPQETVTWKAIFSHKTLADVEITLV